VRLSAGCQLASLLLVSPPSAGCSAWASAAQDQRSGLARLWDSRAAGSLDEGRGDLAGPRLRGESGVGGGQVDAAPATVDPGLPGMPVAG